MAHIGKYGEVKRHPHRDRMGSASVSENTHYGMIIAGTVTGIAGVAGAKLKPTFRRDLFFGLTAIANTISDVRKGETVGAAIVANSLTTAAGIAIYSGAKALSTKGLASLKATLVANGETGKLMSAYKALREVRSTFPVLQTILSHETVGLGAAVATIPFAHRLIKRFVHGIENHQKNTQVMHPSTLYNQAGSRKGQHETGLQPILPSDVGTFSLNSNLRTHYNEQEALNSL
jgi:hypothetical protein